MDPKNNESKKSSEPAEQHQSNDQPSAQSPSHLPMTSNQMEHMGAPSGTEEEHPTEAFREVLDSLTPPSVQLNTRQPVVMQLASLLSARAKRNNGSSKVRLSAAVAATSSKSNNKSKVHDKKRSTLPDVVRKVRATMGAAELMKEIRARRDEYLQTVENLLTKSNRKNKYAEDHPYVALRKRIEAMARAGKQEYNVKYDPLLNNPKFKDTNIYIYATGYDNERKKQARREHFQFGLNPDSRYDQDTIDPYLYDPTAKPGISEWSSTLETNVAFLALLFSASNLFRFPHACYNNGGIIFFLVYCFLIVTFVQPLIFFEMLIGQFSFRGEWGFAKVHKYARGFPHALVFVNLTFVTLHNAVLGYSGLYAVGSLYTSPGTCNSEWSSKTNCIPYDKLEVSKAVMMSKSKWLETHFHEERKGFLNATLYLSTELFFRFYILNWKGKLIKEFFHWRFVITFLVVITIIMPASIQTYLASGVTRIWIYLAFALPVLLTLVLFHQYAFRDAYNTPRYFSVFNWDHLATLSFWCDALEMAISTVGPGYGLFIRVSERINFRYSKILKTSWIISIFTMIFCLLCAMVVYTELAILGLIAEAKEFTYIFAEGFGVTFVSLSGALLKCGPKWVFLTMFAGMTVFNVWPQIVATQMSISYFREIIPLKNVLASKVVGAAITIVYVIGLISVYASHAQFTTTDSFDLFGGTGAAGIILLSEIGIALVLYGFREFMTDIEILLDQQVSFTFQIQMRYLVAPIITFAIFLVGIRWFHSPPVLIETKGTSHQSFFVGLLLNTLPIIIMATFAYLEMLKLNKVAPSVENTKFIDRKKAYEVFWKNKPRWTERRGAVFTKTTHTINAFKPQNQLTANARDMYDAHTSLKQSLRELYAFIKTKILWNDFTNKILIRKKFKSMHQVAHYMMRREETIKISMEVTFLKNIIHQCSISDLTASCSKKLETKQQLSEKEAFYLDRLLKTVDYFSEESDFIETETEDTVAPTWSSILRGPEVLSRKSSSSDNSLVYRRAVGKQERSDEEIRLDLVVRIKRKLGMPYNNDFGRLCSLRNLRLNKEAESACINDATPEEHWITIKVTKSNLTPVLTNIRVIVVRNADHFVLRRLPIPRPIVIRITDKALDSYPGDDERHKIFNFVIAKMKAHLWKVDFSRLQQPDNRTSLLENLTEDVYSFLDPVKTCIVIVESSQQFIWEVDKFKWLTPPVRRQHRVDEIPPKIDPTFEMEGVTVVELVNRLAENRRIDRMWKEPPDLKYHPPKDDSSSSGSSSPVHYRVYSSSSSTPSDEEINPNSEPKVLHGRHGQKKQKANLVDENTFKQNRRAFKRILKSEKKDPLSSTSNDSLSDLESVRRLTIDDWKMRRHDNYKPIYILHNKPGELRQSIKVFPNAPLISVQNEEVETDEVLTDGLSTQPVWSHADEQLQAMQAEQNQTTYEIVSDPVNVNRDYFSNLRNDFDHFVYYTEGRTLIIEKKAKKELFEMADSDDSIASTWVVNSRMTDLTLFRTAAQTRFPEYDEEETSLDSSQTMPKL